MKIRNYSPYDKAACIAIFDSNTPKYFDPAEREGLERWLVAHGEGRTTYPGNLAERFYVVELGGYVVACGGFSVRQGNVVSMSWGMVENAHHKEGVGKALFVYRLREIARDYPQHKVVIDTSQHTYGFFEKQGFVVTAIQKDYYGKGLDRYDMEAAPADTPTAG